MDCPTLKDVRQFFVQAFGEDVPQLKSPTPPAPKAPAQPVPQPVASTVSSLSSSIKMNAPTPLQTIKDGSNKRPLFLCPDGSGSAAVYGGLPSLGRPVFGVNSPFLSEPADWTVEDLAALYLKSIKMAQPEGPYMIGGELLQIQLTRQGKTDAYAYFASSPTPEQVGALAVSSRTISRGCSKRQTTQKTACRSYSYWTLPVPSISLR